MASQNMRDDDLGHDAGKEKVTRSWPPAPLGSVGGAACLAASPPGRVGGAIAARRAADGRPPAGLAAVRFGGRRGGLRVWWFWRLPP
ncbi:hypothetical protein KSP39_PZI012150 [Platanthera zijinensis]|uniref:Uncharacterized protein n=1 Tax=Platanthera zijinensis TaxID=2320716 RepID=A0AAP0G4J1_9ASPA